MFTPSQPLPESTSRAATVVPPIVFLVAPLPMYTPLAELATALAPLRPADEVPLD